MSIPQLQEASLEIRDFHPDDANNVEFVVLSVLHEWGFLPSAKDLQELEAMQSQNPFEAFFVAEDPVVGVVGCAGIARIDEATCELRKIYLLKRFRGKAIGKSLLDTCVGIAKKRKYRRMRLEVHSAMTISAPFYLRNGFIREPSEAATGPTANQVYYKIL
jgi:GNAT superfamily N-acetyltransferase